MLNAPSGWPPAPPPHRPANPASNAGWRIRHSWWLLLPILGMGCLSGAGFLYIGSRARRPAWWIPGIAYMLVAWSSFLVVGGTDQENPASDWAIGLWFAIWAASVVHACLINSSWLQWRAHYVPWFAEPAAPPPTWQPAAASGPSAPVDRPGATPAVPQAFAAAPVPLPPAMQVQPDAYFARPAVLDVNTATIEELVRLPGFDLARAHRTVAERQARSGFAGVEEFAAAAGLAPHQFAPLRAQLTCSPPRLPPTTPQGRVLDV